MSSAPSPWTRLARRVFHDGETLLLVDSDALQESWRRIALRDLTALVLMRTRAYGVVTLLSLLGMGSFLLYVSALVVPADPDAWLPVSLVFLGPYLIWILIHLIRGPTCVLTVQTAVGVYVVPEVKRLRQGRRLLRELDGVALRLQTPAAHPEAVFADAPATGTAAAPAD